jgi:hypothetical protein
MSSTSYVYEHIRNDTNKVFYVGKGKDKRAYSVHKRNQYWNNIVNKCGGFTVKFIAKDLDEELALLVEVERIDQLKILGYVLCNLTEGGEGASGYKHTKEALEKISAASKAFMTGRRMPEESIAKMIASKKDYKHTEETKQKIAVSLIGNKRASGNKNRLGIKHTDETKRKISKTKRNKGLK